MVEQPKEKWNVQKVPTEFAPMVVNNVAEEVLTIEQALALILNKLDKLENYLGK